jgi:hypothetical protein
MANAETIARLRRHAGFPAEVSSPSAPSIADCTWADSPSRGRVTEGVEDFIATLSELNLELNGPTPSESYAAGTDIPRDAAYAVAEVVRMLRDAAGSQAVTGDESVLADAAWSIEVAWSGLLAGDIDDLPQHVAEERAARR